MSLFIIANMEFWNIFSALYCIQYIYETTKIEGQKGVFMETLKPL